MLRCFAAVLIHLIFSLCLFGQRDSEGLSIENIVEQFVESNELEDFDITHIIESLSIYQRSPLNINTASEAEFAELFFLSAPEIAAILAHRQAFGPFIALEELQSVDGLNTAVIPLIRPYITLSNNDLIDYNFGELLKAGSSNLFLKYKRFLETKAGYTANEFGEKAYQGSPDYLYARYRFDAGRKLRFGFTMERDAGEPFFKGVNKTGFDFYSAYVYAEKVHPMVRAVNIGDYTLNMGQGLILHNEFGANKSVYTTDIKKDGRPFRPFSSVNETNAFRGIAVTTEPFENIQLTLFYSNKGTDGTLTADTTMADDFGSFTSIIRSGYHRTELEILKKSSVRQTNFGGVLGYRFKRLQFGLNYLTYQFSHPIRPGDDAYRLFNFNGKTLTNASIDYAWRYRNVNVFGEVARSDNGGLAQIHSALVGLDKKLDLALSYRKYDKDYHVLEGNALSESSLPFNEEGFYLGLESRVNNQWKWAAYLDFFKHPWLKFRVDAPSSGREFLFRIDHIKKRRYHLYLQYRYETKEINSSLTDQKTDRLTPTHGHRLRLHFSYSVTPEIEVRSRTETNQFSKDGLFKRGYLMYQDFFYRPKARPFAFNTRLCLFDTDGFDARIYTYENDLLYEFYIPFFQGRGVRSYLNFKYDVFRDAVWEFKLSQTFLHDVNSIGSGLERIDGNRRTEFETQFRLKF